MATENKDMQQKRGTAAEWESENTVLLAGEIGLETDMGRTKIGDGSTAWNSLGYTDDVDGGDSSAGQATLKQRRDSAANWTSNDPTLPAGVWAKESDTGRVKIGDGSTAWTSLPYLEDDMVIDGGSP